MVTPPVEKVVRFREGDGRERPLALPNRMEEDLFRE